MNASWYTEHDLKEVQRRLSDAKLGLSNFPYSEHYKRLVADYSDYELELRRRLKAQQLQEAQAEGERPRGRGVSERRDGQ